MGAALYEIVGVTLLFVGLAGFILCFIMLIMMSRGIETTPKFALGPRGPSAFAKRFCVILIKIVETRLAREGE